MKPGRLLIAVIVLAGLGGALWWSNRDEKAKEGKPAADAPPKILAIKEDSVKEIDIKRQGGENTSVRFNDKGKWEITSPKPLMADPTSVAQMTSAMSNLTSDRMVDPNVTDLASYGLGAGGARSGRRDERRQEHTASDRRRDPHGKQRVREDRRRPAAVHDAEQQ